MPTEEALRARIIANPGTWLVTGAAGFIGSNLLEALLELDQRVIGFDNFATGSPENLAEVERAVGRARWGRLQFIEGDIRSPVECREACRSVRYVLHQAALGSVPQSIEDPLAYHASNVTGFLNLRLAARDAGVSRFVYASSSATYGDHAGLPQQEPHIGKPLSPYGLTKYVDELYAELFARCYGTGSIGLRYFNVFGPRQDPQGAYAAVIPQWVARMIRGEPVHINGDGRTARDFCYVANVVQANLRAATVDDPAAVNQVYNIALGEMTTLSQLYATLRELLAPRHPHLRDSRPEHRDFRPGDVPLSQADIGKAMRLLGYRPQWRLREGLARAIDWYARSLPAPRAATQASLASGTRYLRTV